MKFILDEFEYGGLNKSVQKVLTPEIEIIDENGNVIKLWLKKSLNKDEQDYGYLCAKNENGAERCIMSFKKGQFLKVGLGLDEFKGLKLKNNKIKELKR